MVSISWTCSIVQCSIIVTALFISSIKTSNLLFHHRSYHTSIIVGDYLYIDGGELATWNGTGNGYEDGYGAQDQVSGYCDQPPGSTQNQCIGNITNYADPSTYSIDLTSSWTNETVVLNKIPKNGPPVVNQGVVWLDASKESFYAYDGSTSEATGIIAQPGPNALWQFFPSGTGGGIWSSVAAPSNTNFSQLSRCFAPAYASGAGLGFALGGVQDGQTIAGYTDAYPAGLVIYNTSSQAWLNISALGYSSDGTSARAAAHFVPSFGPNGLLFVMGGQVGSAATYVSTNSVNFFDPVSQQWKVQPVSGTPPPPSESSCVVGAPGDNGTYEIFHFGGDAGSNIYDSVTLGNVFVLSLPAFNWQNATNSGRTAAMARSLHTCNIRNKQMIVVGGSVYTVAGSASISAETQGDGGIYYSNADPWPQGLGVFDLTEMVWADSYDPSAGPYVTPKVVKEYYVKNPRYPDTLLQDPTLRDWFKVPRSNSNTTNTPPESASTKGSSNNTGAIAGGVVGGVLAVVLVAAIIWLILRHRKRREQSHGYSQPPQGEETSKFELQTPKQHNSRASKVEMPNNFQQWGRIDHKEAAGRPIHEMDGGRPELSA